MVESRLNKREMPDMAEIVDPPPVRGPPPGELGATQWPFFPPSACVRRESRARYVPEVLLSLVDGAHPAERPAGAVEATHTLLR